MFSIIRFIQLKFKKPRWWPASTSIVAFSLALLITTRFNAAEIIPPTPAAIFDLRSLGYTPLSNAARLGGAANVSVDFLDRTRLLVTFNPKRMFKRLPECPTTHADRLVHAVVFDISSGRAVKETDWYLHDSDRYVWNLGSGRFLLRRLNKLYQVDSDLNQKLVFDSPKKLVWISVTPDYSQILVEASDDAVLDQVPTQNKDLPPDHGRMKISFLDSHSFNVQHTITAKTPILLEATKSGFGDVVKNGDVWLVRFGVSAGNRINLTRVKARKAPNLLYSSSSTLLVGRCSTSEAMYNVSAFTIAGKFLWRQRWKDCRHSPVVRRSEDGSRFVISSVVPWDEPTPTPGSNGSDGEDDLLRQSVQVLETASGGSVFSMRATPAVMDGENVALSPDGRSLAALADSAIALYSLPEPASGEAGLYSAITADPELKDLLANFGSSAGKDEPLEISNGREPADPVKSELPNHGPRNHGPSENAPPENDAPSANPATTGDAGTPDARPKTAGRIEGKTETTIAGPSLAGVAEEPPPAIVLRSLTQIVAVDVVITDGKGNLIRNIPQDEFAVTEDGKPQAVRYFQEYSDSNQAASTAAAETEKLPVLPPNFFSNATQPTGADSTTVILFDLLNTPPEDQARAQAELIKFVKAKPPGLQFAIYTLARQLQMVQGFTKDGDMLLTAAKGKKGSLRYRVMADSDTMIHQAIETANHIVTQNPNEFKYQIDTLKELQAEGRAEDADRRMYQTIGAFAQLARALSGIPGRKNLVWLSGSFPLAIFPTSSGSFSGPLRTYGDNLKKAANLLTEAHVSVYPVDVHGLTAESAYDLSADKFSPVPPQANASRSNPGATPTSPLDDLQDQRNIEAQGRDNGRATMDALASQTGGEAFHDQNDIARAVKTASTHGSNYYALSYTPASKRYDGSFRKIKVSLKSRKYHLAYRSGYYAVDPSTPPKASRDLRAGLSLAAMQPGSPESRQVVFATRVLPIGKPKLEDDNSASNRVDHRKGNVRRKVQHYGIDYLVTPTDLHFSTGEDGKYHGTLHFMVAASNEDGLLLTSRVSQLAADFSTKDFQIVLKAGLRLHQEVDIPLDCTSLRVGVEDVANAHIGTVEIPLPVKTPPELAENGGKPHSLPQVEPD